MPQQWLTDNGFLNFLIWFGFIIALIEILTFIHEGGHLFVAKINKVDVAEFSVGFGPKIFQFGKTTKYTLRWIPFGGYVAVLTQEVVDILEKIKTEPLTPEGVQRVSKQVRPFDINYEIENKKILEKISFPRKVLFALGGIIFNYIFMFAFILMSTGTIGVVNATESFYIPCVQTSNSSGQASRTITLVTDVEIDNNYNGTNFIPTSTIGSFDDFWVYLSIFNNLATAPTNNAVRISTNTDCVISVNPNPGQVTMFFTNNNLISSWNVSNSNLPYFIANTTFNNYTLTTNLIYQQFKYEVPENVFVSALSNSFVEIGNGFLLLFTFGTVQINDFPTDHQYYSIFADDRGENSYLLGWFAFFYYVILFSALLIIFNILPIPPLDGFRAAEWTIEGTTGKKLSPEMQAKVTRTGWTIIMIWTIFLLFIPLFI